MLRAALIWFALTLGLYSVELEMMPTNAITHTVEDPCTFIGKVECSPAFIDVVESIAVNEHIPDYNGNPFVTYVGDDAGRGISFGFAQFNEKSGMLGKVVREVRRNTEPGTKIYKNLSYVLRKMNGYKTRRDKILIRSILRRQTGLAMKTAQLKVFIDEIYIDTYFEAIGNGSYDMETLTQLIDHRVNAGVGSMRWVIKHAGVYADANTICKWRIKAYKSFRDYRQYGKTWKKRVTTIGDRFDDIRHNGKINKENNNDE